MTRGRLFVLVAVALLAGAGGFLVGRTTSDTGGPPAGGNGTPPPEVTATVRTAPVTEGQVSETVEAYGEVAPGPGGARSVALDYAARISTIYVRPGQAVTRGQKLLSVKASPTTGLAVDEAKINAQAARQQLDAMSRRQALGLADQASVDAAQASWRTAEARLANLKHQQAATQRVIRAREAGSVTAIPAGPGALVPAGQALVVLTESGGHEARLGVEPDAARAARLGTTVTLRPVLGHGAPVQGRLEAVDGAVDRATGLVSLHLSLPPDAALVPGEAVHGRLVLREAKGLVVPHAAVLPVGGHSVLFTVVKGRAVRHVVKVVLASDTRLVVQGAGLAKGQQVVILGNAELEDGMAVRAESGR